ncbi:hypothetical protein LOK49_LG02G04029 [Camellia lanceoleosa]|uniref:Uncharacterized protein n=1 Tax=Camellia lanceoleosa TaxID=1840588 RepID=A0ACC0ISR5_9ERIC|nr:hypothetical protein LOK49_LG02G04029 [Camellia lanceoleosa]
MSLRRSFLSRRINSRSFSLSKSLKEFKTLDIATQIEVKPSSNCDEATIVFRQQQWRSGRKSESLRSSPLEASPMTSHLNELLFTVLRLLFFGSQAFASD